MNLSTLKGAVKAALPQSAFEFLLSLKYTSDRLLPGHERYAALVRGGHGLEIGGPSHLFKTLLPLYRVARRVDGVNFARETVWEGRIREGDDSFHYYGNHRGTQYIREATQLTDIGDAAYDFVLSSNCLEHVANPLAALVEWHRVLKPGGALVLVLPNKVDNFDHRRPDTTLEHLVADFERSTGEDDLTHLDEILRLHDLARDPPAGDAAAFRERSLDNLRHRALHHHVFAPAVIRQMLEFANFDVALSASTAKDHFAAALKK